MLKRLGAHRAPLTLMVALMMTCALRAPCLAEEQAPGAGASAGTGAEAAWIVHTYWSVSDVMGDSESEHYVFFENGLFIHDATGAACQGNGSAPKRALGHAGQWRIEAGALTLTHALAWTDPKARCVTIDERYGDVLTLGASRARAVKAGGAQALIMHNEAAALTDAYRDSKGDELVRFGTARAAELGPQLSRERRDGRHTALALNGQPLYGLLHGLTREEYLTMGGHDLPRALWAYLGCEEGAEGAVCAP